MKKMNLLLVSLLVVSCIGCTAYDATKTGVSDSYSGVKTIFSDGATLIGKILQGGDITISIKTNAAYNDKTDSTTVVDGEVK